MCEGIGDEAVAEILRAAADKLDPEKNGGE